MRVNQLDAELLDEELFGLLQSQLWNAFKYWNIKDTYTPELQALLRVALFKLSIWDRDASYGAMLQNLKYRDERNSGLVSARPSRSQKLLYGLITVGGRYAWTKTELLMTREGWGELSEDTWRNRIYRALQQLTTIHSALSTVNFLIFLHKGAYRTLVDRLLRMRLVPATRNLSRQVSFDFLNRQLVWHAFTEFLLFILPLLRLPRLKRKIVRFIAPKTPTNLLGFLPERTCAVCYSENAANTDIQNAYETVECSHRYCYVCLMSKIRIEEGEGWNCLRCGTLVRSGKQWIEKCDVDLGTHDEVEDKSGESDVDEDEVEEADSDVGSGSDESDGDGEVEVDSASDFDSDINGEDVQSEAELAE
ncbi:peroxisome assembly protein (Peroxin-2) [Saitoella coloradoensis]